MAGIIECVPNFSEGKDRAIIEEIASAINSVEGSKVVDIDMGEDTNRTVVTFFGSPESVAESAFLAVKRASELIDMSHHKGAHPRMGATDVLPFIPVSGASMEDCVEISKAVGKRIGEELGIPVYLYEESASSEERKNLAYLRAGEYEALPKKLSDGEGKLEPDYGPNYYSDKIEKTGSVVSGAREFLIAYNINLNTKDKLLASDIALDIREKGRVKRGGSPTPFYRDGEIIRDENGNKIEVPGIFKHCKAIGWFIPEYGRAQISINLTNYKITPVHKVYDEVCKIASQRGLQVTGSEIVGLVPKAAMIEAGRHYLRKQLKPTGYPERELIEIAAYSMGLSDATLFTLDEKIVEYVLAKEGLIDLPVSAFVDEVQTDSMAPGGGSVAALGGAVGAGLIAMVTNLTTGKEHLAVYDEICRLGNDLGDLAQALKQGIDDDTVAFNKVVAAMRMPKKTDEQSAARDAAIQSAYKAAVKAPHLNAMRCLEVLRIAKQVAPIGLESAASDVAVGARFAHAGMHSAILNVKINLPEINDEVYRQGIAAEVGEIAKEGDQLLKEILEISEGKIG